MPYKMQQRQPSSHRQCDHEGQAYTHTSGAEEASVGPTSSQSYGY